MISHVQLQLIDNLFMFNAKFHQNWQIKKEAKNKMLYLSTLTYGQKTSKTYKMVVGAIHKIRPNFQTPLPPDVRIFLKNQHHSIIIIFVNFCFIQTVIDRIICSDLFSDSYSDL